jgi:hypothetical protein
MMNSCKLLDMSVPLSDTSSCWQESSVNLISHNPHCRPGAMLWSPIPHLVPSIVVWLLFSCNYIGRSYAWSWWHLSFLSALLNLENGSPSAGLFLFILFDLLVSKSCRNLVVWLVPCLAREQFFNLNYASYLTVRFLVLGAMTKTRAFWWTHLNR